MDEIIKGSSFSSYWYTDIREIVTIKDMLAGSADLYRANPAFWVKKKKGSPYEAVNYELLQHDVNALGTMLCHMGLKGERIAVMGQNSYEWIVSYLSVINGTGIVVPIDKELTGPEIGNLLRAGDAHTIFCTRQECKKLAGLPEIDRLIVMEFYGDRTDIHEQLEPVTDDNFDRNKYMNMILGDAASGSDAETVTADLKDSEQRKVEVYSWRELLAWGEQLLTGKFSVDPAKEADVEASAAKAGDPHSGLGEEDRVPDRSFLDAEIDPDALAVILFTSGTTGNPKGVMLSHRNITSNIMDVCRICQVYQSDKTLSLLPIHHTYECTLGMLLVLYRGASTAFCEGFKYISQNMKEAQNTFIIVVPRVLELVYDRIQKGIEKQGKEKTFRRAMKVNKALRKVGINISRTIFKSVIDGLGGKLRVVITGAAALNPNIFRAFEDFGIMVLQGYGMTECTPLISGTPGSAPDERYRKAGSVGTTVDKGEIKIINKDENGIGEVLFRGPNVMLGYYNMPEETADTIEPDGFMHTGDLGFVDKEGWLYLTGRAKNVIVTKTGENVYPEEIEDEIRSDPAIEECMVFPYNDHGEETVGIQILPAMENITEQLGCEPSEAELNEYFKKLVTDFNQNLAVYKRIRAVFVRKEDFIRTTTKKIRRQDNPLTPETIIGYK
ncbi:MAG: AMP-binding protein [Eubacterium sp.]|nr:AMP-binding protein [Eubacterium sp.]